MSVAVDDRHEARQHTRHAVQFDYALLLLATNHKAFVDVLRWTIFCSSFFEINSFLRGELEAGRKQEQKMKLRNKREKKKKQFLLSLLFITEVGECASTNASFETH